MTDHFIKYANSFQTVSRLGLGREEALLRYLGNPERDLHCLHIAGTNGKGSVAVYLSSILRVAGYRVGLYTSPNLLWVNERIVVDGKMISDSDLGLLLSEVEAASAAVEQELGEKPTQFEIWTAAAFRWFSGRTDYVVLETGLGGEFDATNVIPSNVMSIFTRIDLDHMQYLGNTVAEISRTKSRIIKRQSETGIVVSAPQLPEAAEQLALTAEKLGSQIVFVTPPPPGIHEGICERFSYGGLALSPSVGGIHQIENASVAAEVAKRMGIPDAAICTGVSNARHPARLELLSVNPVVLYDGGHNPNGITALNRSLDRYFPGEEMTVIFACMKDKDIAPSLCLLAEPRREFIFTTVQNNGRAMPAEDLRRRAAELGIAGISEPTLTAALARARAKGQMTLICGSLYLYGDLPR